MSRKGGAALQKDVPWRASSAAKPIPKIHHSPILRLPQTPYSNYALSVMKVRSNIINDYVYNSYLILWVFVFLMFVVNYGRLMVVFQCKDIVFLFVHLCICSFCSCCCGFLIRSDVN